MYAILATMSSLSQWFPRGSELEDDEGEGGNALGEGHELRPYLPLTRPDTPLGRLVRTPLIKRDTAEDAEE